MGVPKQKWTSEEEAALKAGIAKYGLGKWIKIVKDAEFNSVLHMRSNVDLKDKWRNMVYGSRQRSRPAMSQPIQNHENTSQEENNLQICIVNPLPESSPQPLQIDYPKKPIPMPRLVSLILDIISAIKNPHGSTRSEIAKYIEENHSSPPNLRRLLKQELMNLIDNGKVIKVKHRYKIKIPLGMCNLRRDKLLLLICHDLEEDEGHPYAPIADGMEPATRTRNKSRGMRTRTRRPSERIILQKLKKPVFDKDGAGSSSSNPVDLR